MYTTGDDERKKQETEEKRKKKPRINKGGISNSSRVTQKSTANKPEVNTPSDLEIAERELKDVTNKFKDHMKARMAVEKKLKSITNEEARKAIEQELRDAQNMENATQAEFKKANQKVRDLKNKEVIKKMPEVKQEVSISQTAPQTEVKPTIEQPEAKKESTQPVLQSDQQAQRFVAAQRASENLSRQPLTEEAKEKQLKKPLPPLSPKPVTPQHERLSSSSIRTAPKPQPTDELTNSTSTVLQIKTKLETAIKEYKVQKPGEFDWEFKLSADKKELTVSAQGSDASKPKQELFTVKEIPDGTQFNFPKEPALTARTASITIQACEVPIELNSKSMRDIEMFLKAAKEQGKEITLTPETKQFLQDEKAKVKPDETFNPILEEALEKQKSSSSKPK